MELVLAGILDHVFVAADAAGLKSLAGQLLVLIGHQVNTGREDIDWHLLGAQVKYPDLGVWEVQGAWSPTRGSWISSGSSPGTPLQNLDFG